MSDFNRQEIHQDFDEFFPIQSDVGRRAVSIPAAKMLAAVSAMVLSALLMINTYVDCFATEIFPGSAVLDINVINMHTEQSIDWQLESDSGELIRTDRLENDSLILSLDNLTPDTKYVIRFYTNTSEGPQEIGSYSFTTGTTPQNNPGSPGTPPPAQPPVDAVTPSPVVSVSPAPSPTPAVSPVPSPSPTAAPTPTVIPTTAPPPAANPTPAPTVTPVATPEPEETPQPTPEITVAPSEEPAPEYEGPAALEPILADVLGGIAPEVSTAPVDMQIDFGFELNDAQMTDIVVEHQLFEIYYIDGSEHPLEDAQSVTYTPAADENNGVTANHFRTIYDFSEQTKYVVTATLNYTMPESTEVQSLTSSYELVPFMYLGGNDERTSNTLTVNSMEPSEDGANMLVNYTVRISEVHKGTGKLIPDLANTYCYIGEYSVEQQIDAADIDIDSNGITTYTAEIAMPIEAFDAGGILYINSDITSRWSVEAASGNMATLSYTSANAYTEIRTGTTYEVSLQNTGNTDTIINSDFAHGIQLSSVFIDFDGEYTDTAELIAGEVVFVGFAFTGTATQDINIEPSLVTNSEASLENMWCETIGVSAGETIDRILWCYFTMPRTNISVEPRVTIV